MVDNLSLNKNNEDQANKEEKSYNSAVEKEKMSDAERLDARKSRRDNLSARQDDIDFDDYEQQSQNRKKILKADSQIEIKRITAEQVEIDRMLTDNDRRSRELTKKLINI